MVSVSPVGQILPGVMPAGGAAARSSGSVESFSRILQQKLEQVEALQEKADSLLEGFITGQVGNVHEVVLAAQQAELALQLTVELRNRVVEAYQEVSRMQV